VSSPLSEALPGAGRDLAGRTCVITGATSGIGLEVARALAARGATLVMIGRDSRRTSAAADQLTVAGATPVSAVIADLASLSAVRSAAREIAARHRAIDILVNNAGIWMTRRATSMDGFELTWATNVLSHHVLTCALIDPLRAARAARIVNVASTYAGDLDLDDVEFKRRRWSGIAAYRQSKLAQRMWTWALAARLQGTAVTVNAVHPGGVNTGIYRSPRGFAGAALRLYARIAKATPRQGADTPVWVATAAELKGVTGRFWAGRKEISCPYRDPSSLNRLWALLEAQAAHAVEISQRPDMRAAGRT
jgi:NAD(P)-dependent dehydrogenase (short-subunit alcohol dehydrogenase family)